MFALLSKLFGSSKQRKMKRFKSLIERINALEENLINLKDEDLREKSFQLKGRAAGSLDEILPEAFALVREAAKRVSGTRHFDVQILGGIVLHYGGIAEMSTGEGKTLAVTAPAYLRSLKGLGMHVVTANDYLAQRDALWMGGIFRYLGASVGCITSGMDDKERAAAYQCDITYATNNELGFDYLRDNTKYSAESRVQRRLYAACIDEVDSILIDEARTPLVLSGQSRENLYTWNVIDPIVRALRDEDYILDEKLCTISLSEEGATRVEAALQKSQLLSSNSELYDPENADLVYQINQSLRAYKLFKKDADYIVREGKVLCINKNTGRVSDGRRYSAGLHQALEAKEKVEILEENEEIASITFQNYFRMYDHLSGMTGTAMTESEEFKKIYELEVFSIPTHKPINRKDLEDSLYATEKDKHIGICQLVKERHEAGQPILIGTGDIEQSEVISAMLSELSIPHSVLNAKNHQAEAFVVAQAGRFKNVTISTNMAGRGTDIKLGGDAKMLFKNYLQENPQDSETRQQEVKASIEEECSLNKQKAIDAGGLFVIGALRHESRRIDNQLRGRSGRQGDIGSSKFFVSLEDPLVRLFATDKKVAFLKKNLGIEEGQSAHHPLISMVIATAQKRIENQHYEARQHLLKFDDVLNEQRSLIYKQRTEFLEAGAEETQATFLQIASDLVSSLAEQILGAQSQGDNSEKEKLIKKLCSLTSITSVTLASQDKLVEDAMRDIKASYLAKEGCYGQDMVHQTVRYVKLATLDQCWKEHIMSLAIIKEAIQNRAYAQKDPLNEYKSEAFESFEQMLENFSRLFVPRVCRLEIMPKNVSIEGATYLTARRNQPCPCASGKKFKHCHGLR